MALPPDRDTVEGRIQAEHSTSPDRDETLKAAETAAAADDIGRRSSTGKHVHNITIAGVYLLGGAVILMLLALFYNLTVSTRFRFLTDPQRSDLQNFLFSGLIGSLLSEGARRAFAR